MTETITLRPATLDDTAAIVALNAAVVAVTSPMDHPGFQALLAISAFCDVAQQRGEVLGFVLAMQNGAAYANGNYQWFAERLNRFVYIDRIVIGDRARGLGLGTMLYDHVTDQAVRRGSLVMAAEMDLIPANPGSLDFHKKRGFVEIGTRRLDSGKTVSMQIKGLESGRATD